MPVPAQTYASLALPGSRSYAIVHHPVIRELHDAQLCGRRSQSSFELGCCREVLEDLVDRAISQPPLLVGVACNIDAD